MQYPPPHAQSSTIAEERLRAEMALHLRLGGILLEAADLPAALQRVLADICDTAGWSFAEAWVPDDSGETLRCLAAHSADPAARELFWGSIRTLRLPSGAGPAGEAWRTRRTVWISDVEGFPGFVRPELAKSFHLKTGVGVPILTGEVVVAVLVFFLQAVSSEDRSLMDLFSREAAQLGLFVRWKQAEALLRERERQLAEAQNISAVGSWSMDLASSHMQCSDQFFRNLGLEPRPGGISLYEALAMIHPEDRAFVLQRRKLLQEGAPPLDHAHLRVVLPEGRTRILEVRIDVQAGPDGAPARLLGTAQNVTRRVEAEALLQQQSAALEEKVSRRTAQWKAANERLQAEILERRRAELSQQRWSDLLREVLQAADELISCTTLESFYRRAVELPRERLGLERTGLLVVVGDRMLGTFGTDSHGRTVDESGLCFGIPLDEISLEPWAERLESIRAGGVRWFRKEVDVYPQLGGTEPDQPARGGWVVITPVLHKGELLGFFSNDTALTGRELDPVLQEVLAVYTSVLGSLLQGRKVALQLAEEEQRLRLMVENLPAGAVYVANERLTMNRVVEKITGFERHEIDSLDSWFAALYGERCDEVRAFYEADRSAGFPAPRTVDLRRKDGKERHVSFAAYAYQGAEVWLIQDVTEQVEADAQIAQYQQQLRSLATEIALAAEQERRRIATGLHDQVVQLLALAKIKLGALETDLALAPPRTESLDAIRRLLESAIQETRSLTFELSPPVLYELGLGPAIEWLAERTGRKHGLRCAVSRPRERLPVLPTHAVVVFQVLRELVANAVNHACADRLDFRVRADEAWIHIDVEDDGIGFDPASLALPLQQEDRHFGLFNVRECMQQLGGGVVIDSAPGRGCRVELRIPSVDPQQETPDKAL